MLFSSDERSSVIPNTAGVRQQRIDHAAAGLASLRERHGGRRVVLASSSNVAWALGGLSTPIDRTACLDPVWVVVGDDVTLVTSSVEVPRIQALLDDSGLQARIEVAPWFESNAHHDVIDRLLGEDFASDGVGGIDISHELVATRLSLCEAEVNLLTEVAQRATAVVEAAAHHWVPGHTSDVEVASWVQEGIEALGADSVCLIVGGDERMTRFRHPIMDGSVSSQRLMIVIVARCQGLHVATTRIVGEMNEEFREALSACSEIQLRVLSACRRGATWGDVYSALGEAYADVGHATAWREHFQGGPIGYLQREFELSPQSQASPWWDELVPSRVAVAFNPSLTGGAKVEDTHLVENSQVYCLSDTGQWPRVGEKSSGALVAAQRGRVA